MIEREKATAARTVCLGARKARDPQVTGNVRARHRQLRAAASSQG